jgi:transposase
MRNGTGNNEAERPGAEERFNAYEWKIKSVEYLPIFRAYLDKLRLQEIVAELVPSPTEISIGVVLQALILDTLRGRTPLYRLDRNFEELDTEVLLGEKIEAGDLNDDLLGRVLDRLYEAGTMKLFSALVREAVRVFGIEEKRFHYDTTSVSVYGDYRYDPESCSPLKVEHGYSKDHRPDLKQFLVSVLCTGERIPVYGQLEDGSSSDKKLNHKLLNEVAVRLKEVNLAPPAFLYIADSAMVTEENLKEFREQEYFITRLPATYGVCEELIESAVKRGEWEKVGALAKIPETKNCPAARYQVASQSVQLYGKAYQAVVVHSSAHDQRRQKRLARRLEEERRQLEQNFTEQCLPQYACREDAEQAARR